MGNAVAKEGALKIKEIAYIHAEGYPGGALKHGPFALINEGTPIFIFAFHDEYQSKMHITAEEVKSRGAYPILVTDLRDNDIPEGVYQKVIKVPEAEIFSPFLSIIPIQYLAYRLALVLDYNPDYPRNLAKCVTTE